MEDIRHIGHYTEQQWGKTQRTRYLKDLEQRLAWLADNPLLGKHRLDIAEGLYNFPQGRHVIFYMIRSDGIDVIGVPHKEMDVIGYFDE
jgi:toxin ParE1/3/4